MNVSGTKGNNATSEIMLAWRYVTRQAGRRRSFRNSRLKRSALHSVGIAVLSAIDLKVDAERLISVFSQPD
jgi:hypothetical protein